MARRLLPAVLLGASAMVFAGCGASEGRTGASATEDVSDPGLADATRYPAGFGATPVAPAPAPSVSDAEIIDATRYAADVGVTTDEALRRLSVADQMGPLGTRIAALAPDRYAGLWISHEGGVGLVVKFTGDPDPALGSRIEDVVRGTPAPVEIRWHAPASWNELRGVRVQDIRTALRRLGMPSDEVANVVTAANGKSSSIWVVLPPASSWSGRESELAARLEKEFGLPFTVTTGDGIPQTSEGRGP